ncbi:MAG: hypothetical protein AAGA48_40120, partial [Myxococcota bacterium]
MRRLTMRLAAFLFLLLVVGSSAGAAPDEEPESSSVSFPTLSDAALGRPPSLRARAAALQDAAVKRRVAQQLAGASATPEQTAEWTSAAATEAAESEALVHVLANLEARPALLESAQANRREATEAVRAALSTVPAPEGIDANALAQVDADELAFEVLLSELRRSPGPLDAASAEADLEALNDPLRAPGAVDRLTFRLPSMAPTPAQAIDQALAQWASEPVLPPNDQPLDGSVAAVWRAMQAVRSEAVTAPFTGARDAAEALEAHLEAWAIAETGRTEQAERAQVEADAALEAADQAIDEEVRNLLQQVAEAQTRNAKELKLPLFDASDEPVTAAQLEKLDQDVANVRTWWSWIVGHDTLSPDAQYTSLLSDMDDLRGREVNRQKAFIAASDALGNATTVIKADTEITDFAESNLDQLPAERQTEVRDALVDWRNANVQWEAHIRERLEAAAPQGWVERVQELGRIKHKLIPELSSRTFRTNLPNDLASEIAFVQPATDYYGRNRRSMLSSQLSSLLTDGNALIQIINGSLFAALLAGLWLFGRLRSSSFALSIAKRIREGRPDLRLSDVRALREPLARTIRNLVDLSFGPLL